MIMDIVFRALANDAEVVTASDIEKECLSTAWSSDQISSLPEYAFYIGAFDKDMLCGIASMYVIAGEGQIMNIAVLPCYRRKGIANGLLCAMFDIANNNNCENITLEVASDNISAISLYEKCGFACVGKRNGFYNGKDALIMEKKL